MLVVPIFAVVAFFYSGLSHALTVHETCKNFPGVDEYGYGPDVSAAVSNAYDYMTTIAKNAVSVANKYQSKSLPPDERVRFASLLTAFGVPEGDSRLPFFLIQLDGKRLLQSLAAASRLVLTCQLAAWGLLGSKLFLEGSIIFCGTPEGKNQWTYVPKTPLGQNWAWRSRFRSEIFYKFALLILYQITKLIPLLTHRTDTESARIPLTKVPTTRQERGLSQYKKTSTSARPVSKDYLPVAFPPLWRIEGKTSRRSKAKIR